MATQLNLLNGSRKVRFWVLNVAGFTGYLATTFLGAVSHDKPDEYLRLIVFSAIIGFTLTIPLRYFYQRLWTKSPAVLVLGVLIGCYTLAMLWRFASNQLYIAWVSNEWQPEKFSEYISGVLSTFYVLLCWSGLYFGVKYYQQLQAEREKTLKATAAAHQAQLKMLRYQLNPHFLFNTLNAISTLILDRANETANLTVSRLSDFLRYTLEHDRSNRTSLRKELEALELYLDIENVRFGSRLTVNKEIETKTLDALVPSLILQPLIENAIKYAVNPREEGGVIRLSSKLLNDKLVLSLADDGPGLNQNASVDPVSCGVGLKNTRQRLRELYGDDQAFTLAPNDPKGLIATINIPFQTDGDD